MPSGLAAPAVATFADLSRRPALGLATLAVGVWLWILPDVCSRAVEDSSALSLEAGLSTIGLLAVAVAAVGGIRAGADHGDMGATAEWRAAPLSPGAYVLGRFLGVAALSTAVILVLVPLLALVQRGELTETPPAIDAALFAVAGLVAGAAHVAAIALCVAAFTTPQLASIVVVAVLVVSRTVLPSLAQRGGPAALAAAVLPDLDRLDWSRDLAFHRPFDAGSAALAIAATLTGTAAAIAAGAWALGRRES